MNGFRDWLNRLMIGRYGMDELNRFMLIAAAVVLLVNIFLSWWILRFIGVVLLILVYCRAFSRTIYKRQEENAKYLNFKSGIFGRRRRKKDEGKRILICPYCKGKLKVPVGAGRIKIRCPHCKAEFEETV
ncbi:MAG: hypothetical protein MR991_06220 [Clostridiales bacterium]|nr:hypothetical protein [Clostridiales bacterium]MDD7036078.1 hypothetical protein [Bacillota bacterium]MDY2920836.1 hypothetical protein [Lentihominibacter sp.]